MTADHNNNSKDSNPLQFIGEAWEKAKKAVNEMGDTFKEVQHKLANPVGPMESGEHGPGTGVFGKTNNAAKGKGFGHD